MTGIQLFVPMRCLTTVKLYVSFSSKRLPMFFSLGPRDLKKTRPCRSQEVESHISTHETFWEFMGSQCTNAIAHRRSWKPQLPIFLKNTFFVGSWIDVRPGSIEWSPCGCSLYFLGLCIFVCRMWNIFDVMVSSKSPWSLCHLVGGLEHFYFPIYRE